MNNIRFDIGDKVAFNVDANFMGTNEFIDNVFKSKDNVFEVTDLEDYKDIRFIKLKLISGEEDHFDGEYLNSRLFKLHTSILLPDE